VSRRAGAFGIAARAASTHPALSLFAMLIVALTAFAGAVAPGLLQQLQDRSLRYALAGTSPGERDFTSTSRGVPVTGGGRDDDGLPPELAAVWGYPLRQLTDVRDDMDPLVRHVLGAARIAVEFDPSEAVRVSEHPTPRSQVLLRYDPQLDDRVTWVEGREPDVNADGVTEFGLTAEAAEAMGWALDEHRMLTRSGNALQEVVLTGIYRVDDPADPDWDHAPLAVHFSRVQRALEDPLNIAVGFTAPADLPTAEAYPDDVSTSIWFPLKIDAVRADDARPLIAALRLFTAAPVDVALTRHSFFSPGFSFRSSAAITMSQTLVRVEAMSAVVALIASGPLAVAIVVLSLTSRMLALRRRVSLQLAEARGASLRLRATLLAVEGAVIGVVGAVAGGAPGALLGDGRGPVVAAVPVLVALTPAIALPVLGLLLARRRARADLGAEAGPARRRRLLVELAVVALAAITAVLVLTHALARDASAPDPLLTALPLLLAAVGCVLTLRLVPAALALIERGVPARRGLVALVGPARARRDPAVRVAPVLAVVVGVAIAVFSVAFSATVESGIRVAARAAAGADLRVSAPYLNQGQLDALASLDGVAATAPIYADEQRDAETSSRELTVTVYVIDVAELRRVQSDPASAIDLPDALRAPAGDAVPVVASADLARLVGSDTMQVREQAVDIVATAPAQTPLGSARTWVAVDRSLADRLVLTPFSPSVVLLDLKPGADAAAVVAQARDIAGGDSAASTPETLASVRLEDPALRGLQFALVAAVAVVAALLALAIGMTLVLGAAARGRLLALLAAVGFRRSRELGLILWEVAPAVVVALPIGAAVGLALPWIVLPALDLTGFVGGAGQPAVQLGGPLPALVVLAFLGVAAVAVLIAAAVARRVTTARTLRSIDDEG
jgi:putative ABC transport system permease protein